MEMNDQIFNELSKSPGFRKAEKKTKNELNTSVVSNSSSKPSTFSKGLKRKKTFLEKTQQKTVKLVPKAQKPSNEKKPSPKHSGAFEIKPHVTVEDEDDEAAENLIDDDSPEVD